MHYHSSPPSPNVTLLLIEFAHTGVFVGGGVSIAWDRSRLAAKDSIEVGALLVGATLLLMVV
jgi:hypothetical protein